MARTVSNTGILLPRDSVVARVPIVAQTAEGFGGANRTYKALNTLYEQLRGTLICDVNPGVILENGGRTSAYYRPGIMGGSDLSDEKAEAYLDVTTVGTAQVDVAITGGGTASWSGNMATKTRVQTSTDPVVEDDASSNDYMDVEVSINSGTVDVEAVLLGYQREKTALTAVGSGNAAYDDSEVVPLDLAAVVANGPHSVARELDAHHMARNLFGRGGQIVQSANMNWVASRGLWCAAPIPAAPGGGVTARFWVRGEDAGGDDITISSGGVSQSVACPTSEAWCGPFDLNIAAPTDDLLAPSWAIFNLAGTSVTDVFSWSGYWRAVSYG